MEVKSNLSLKSDIQVEMIKQSQDVTEKLFNKIIEQLDPKNDNLEKEVANSTGKGVNLNLNA